MKKATSNELKKALIMELARVTDFDGIKTAFGIVAQDYPDSVDELERIAEAVTRELKRG